MRVLVVITALALIAPGAAMAGGLCGNPGIEGRAIAAIPARMPGCGLRGGVEVTAVDGVRLSSPATLDCRTANALHAWVRGAVKPAVGRRGGGLVGLRVAASYACRRINNRPGAKVSEHGRGGAIDISGLIMASGNTVTVQGGWGRGEAGRVLARIRRAACGPFTTVLGPGSDRYHSDHFHLDTKPRRTPWCR